MWHRRPRRCLPRKIVDRSRPRLRLQRGILWHSRRLAVAAATEPKKSQSEGRLARGLERSDTKIDPRIKGILADPRNYFRQYPDQAKNNLRDIAVKSHHWPQPADDKGPANVIYTLEDGVKIPYTIVNRNPDDPENRYGYRHRDKRWPVLLSDAEKAQVATARFFELHAAALVQRQKKTKRSCPRSTEDLLRSLLRPKKDARDELRSLNNQMRCHFERAREQRGDFCSTQSFHLMKPRKVRVTNVGFAGFWGRLCNVFRTTTRPRFSQDQSKKNIKLLTNRKRACPQRLEITLHSLGATLCLDCELSF